MLAKLKMMGQAGKAVSYVFLGLNQVSRFTSKLAVNISNGIRNKGLFKIFLTSDSGEIIKELNNQSASNISEILEQMDNFGIYSVTVEKAVGTQNDN